MITVKKLASLKPRTRIRKAAGIFHICARTLEQKKIIDHDYIEEIIHFLAGQNLESALKARINELHFAVKNGPEPVRSLDSMYYLLLESLGESPADWDLQYRSTESTSGTSREKIESVPSRSGIQLFLDDIRSPFNVGSIFRTADSFGISKILLSPDCPTPDHPRCRRTAMGCTEIIPWEICSVENLPDPKKHPLFALETGGTDISEFIFPSVGTMIIGSEEAGVSVAARNAAAESAGVASIPVCGSKGSLNLSVAAGIALFHWDKAIRNQR